MEVGWGRSLSRRGFVAAIVDVIWYCREIHHVNGFANQTRLLILDIMSGTDRKPS